MSPSGLREKKNEGCRAFPNPCQHLLLFPNCYLMCSHTPALVLKQPSSSRNRKPLGREKRRKSGYIRAVCIGTSLLKQDQTGRRIICIHQVPTPSGPTSCPRGFWGMWTWASFEGGRRRYWATGRRCHLTSQNPVSCFSSFDRDM